MEKWHIPEINILEKKLNTDLAEGLSAREARERLEKYKKRTHGKVKSLFVPQRRSFWHPLLSFVCSPLTVLLLLISLLATIFGREYLGGLVFLSTLAAAVFGGIVSLRAERRLNGMREYAAPMVRVKRGGNTFYTDGRNLVVGDVILLGEGDLLPCDARIVKSDALFVDELFGRADGGISRRRVMKRADISYQDDSVQAPDAENMLYSGSAVVKGSAVALVVEVGESVYLSDYIADGALGGVESESRAVKSLRGTISKIAFICAATLLLLSLLGLLTFRGKEEFIWYFMMLLSSAFLVTGEMLSFAGKEIFASYITRLSINKSAKRKKDNSAAVRTVKAFDRLTEVTDVVLFGTAGLYEGVFKIGSALVSCNRVESLAVDTPESERLLSFINTYVRALRDGGVDSNFNLDGITEALYIHLRTCGFDFSGAALATKSLYYANDIKTGYGYACAETDSSIYRVTMTFDKKALSICRSIRIGQDAVDMDEHSISVINAYLKETEENGSQAVLCISESEGKCIFEGALAIYQPADTEINNVVNEMKSFGINTTVFLPCEERECFKIVKSRSLSSVFEKEIAYASEFRKLGKKITDDIGSYSAYVGFSTEEYSALIAKMRERGSSIAAYGVANEYNEIMAKTDVVVTCDTIRYSTEKHREAVYERMHAEGRDTNLRASQQTRLLSKVTVKRANESGGGIYSLFKAIRMSRGACVSLAQSVLLFALLSANLLTFCAMSVITGNILLDPVQTVSLAAVFALLSATVFSDSEQRFDVISIKRNYTEYPKRLLIKHIPSLISRVSVAFVVTVAVKILDVCGVFGETPAYTLPIFICLLLTMCTEVLIINLKHTKKGEGRSYCWLKVVIAYAILLGICALSTQLPFATELYKNGFGLFEYLIIPGYLAVYGIALLVAYLIGKRRE